MKTMFLIILHPETQEEKKSHDKMIMWYVCVCLKMVDYRYVCGVHKFIGSPMDVRECVKRISIYSKTVFYNIEISRFFFG